MKASSKPSIRLPHRVPASESNSSAIPQSLYTAEALSELKNATPQAPARGSSIRHDVDISVDDSDEHEDVDITTKFGTSAANSSKPTASKALLRDEDTSRIPTAAEIAEKKARRNRLRLEQSALDPSDDYISLHSSSKNSKPIRRASDASSAFSASSTDNHRNGTNKGSLIIPADEFDPADKYGRQESRLQPDDEDIAEGFDDFVEDAGRVSLNKKGKREQDKQRRKDMERQIRRAERGDSGSSSEDENDEESQDAETKEEKARVAAYEVAQTKAGTYSTRHTGSRGHDRQREKEAYDRLRSRIEIPTKLPPIPTPQDVKNRFRNLLVEKEAAVKDSEARLAAVQREKEELRDEEDRVKALLDEAAARFEKVRAELPVEVQERPGAGLEEQGRGLESLGGLSMPTSASAMAGDAQSEPSPEPQPTQGRSMAPPPVPSGMAGRPAQDEDDYY